MSSLVRVLTEISVSTLSRALILNLPTSERSYVEGLKNRLLKKEAATSKVGGLLGRKRR